MYKTLTADAIRDEIIADDPMLMSDAAIRAETIEARRVTDVLEYRDAILLAALHRRGIAHADGAASTATWAQWQTGQRRGDARITLRVGLACGHLPLTAKAWAQGEISAGAAYTICLGMPEGFETDYAALEDQLLGFAAGGNWRDLHRLIDECERRAEALRNRKGEPSDRNRVHHSKVASRWITNANHDDLAGAIIDAALRAATDPVLPDDTRSPAKRRSDAMLRICRYFLSHEKLKLVGGQHPHVSVVYDWTALLNLIPSINRGGPTVTPAQIGALLCDANITRILLGPDGLPLAVGRTERFATAAQRKALAVRDQGCIFPACEMSFDRCTIHHIPPWHPEKPGDPLGRTDLDAMGPECDYHHHLVHQPGWHEQFDGTTYTVTRPNGTTITRHITQSDP